MPFTYVWVNGDGDDVSVPILTKDAALAQAAHDAEVVGGPKPKHILDPFGIVVAAFRSEALFVSETGETKAADDVAEDEAGVYTDVQTPLDGEELAAYADEVAAE